MRPQPVWLPREPDGSRPTGQRRNEVPDVAHEQEPPWQERNPTHLAHVLVALMGSAYTFPSSDLCTEKLAPDNLIDRSEKEHH